MQRRPIRKSTPPEAVIYALAHLHHVATEGYAILRDGPHSEEATKRERVVKYCVLHGIVESLGQVREALVLLKDINSCFAIEAPYIDHLDQWTAFRDDSVHFIDRTHRIPREGQNNAILAESAVGYDADTLAYDWDTDNVRTGVSNTMKLGPAVKKVEEIIYHVNGRIQDAYTRRLIDTPTPLRKK